MQTNDMSKEERYEYWKMVLEDYKESGLSKKAYCRQNGFTPSVLRYWEKRLAENSISSDSDENRFVELTEAIAANDNETGNKVDSVDFIPQIAIDYNGIRILMNADTPTGLLTSIIGELDYA